MISLLFYLVVAVMAAGAMYLAQKQNKKWLIIIPILLLALVAGIRADTVGTDTQRNIRAFEACLQHGSKYVHKEYVYYYLAAFLLRIWHSPNFVFFIYAFAIYGLIFLRLWDFRQSVDLSMASMLFFLYYFGGTMNGLRQYIAVAIIFYASRFLKSGRYWIFMLLLLAAISFHNSAIVAAVFPVLYYVLRNSDFKKQYKLSKWAYVLIGAAGGGLIIGVVWQYAGYFDEFKGLDLGMIFFAKMALLCGAFFFSRKAVTNTDIQTESFSDTSSFQFVFLMSLIGMLFSFANVFIEFAGRMGYYYRIFEITFYGMIFYSGKVDKRLKWGLAAALLLLGCYSLYSYHDIIPYRTIFG